MPRDGSNIYSQPDPDVVADTTIESAKYNNFTNDVAQDLNLPRPIVAGGTGATSAAAAIVNLGGEQAGQVVTNYDSFVFKAGSFYSAVGATAAPNGINAFRGICVVTDVNNLNIQARDVTTNNIYLRTRTAGVWGAWSLDGGSGSFVVSTGSTMTGNLTISSVNPTIILNKAASGGTSNLNGSMNGFSRWSVALGNGTTESGSNAGSDFGVFRFNDAGTLTGTPLLITRSTGKATFENDLTVTGSVTSAITATTGTYYFGSSATKSLNYDGSSYTLVGGTFSVNNNILANGGQLASNQPSGSVQLRLTETTGGWSKYVQVVNGGDLNVLNNASTVIVTLTDNGRFGPSNGYFTKAGSGAALGANVFNINHGTGQQLWIDNTNVGTFAYTSDYRTKKDVSNLSGTWDAVKALRPIKYTHKDFTPLSEMNASRPFMKGDNIEHWGFFAHELQDTLIKSASTGVKDSPDTIQSPNPWTVIAALTKALQEAMMRIEALEAR